MFSAFRFSAIFGIQVTLELIGIPMTRQYVHEPGMSSVKLEEMLTFLCADIILRILQPSSSIAVYYIQFIYSICIAIARSRMVMFSTKVSKLFFFRIKIVNEH